jgi:hypothetical protein
MTTAAQIKRLTKPLLERRNDLVLIGEWIVLKPVHHVARAILIDRTGEAKRFRPTWAVIDLVEGLDIFPLNWGQRLGHPTNSLWFWDDPTIQDALIEVIERVALPILSPIQSLDDFVSFASARQWFPGCMVGRASCGNERFSMIWSRRRAGGSGTSGRYPTRGQIFYMLNDRQLDAYFAFRHKPDAEDGAAAVNRKGEQVRSLASVGGKRFATAYPYFGVARMVLRNLIQSRGSFNKALASWVAES